MPQKPAAAPTEMPAADFEEDTLLPPPARSLLAPEHEPPDEALLEADRAMLPARLSQEKSSPELSSEQSAIPEHVIDVPTMQGFLATRPIDGISDPLAAQSGDAIARVMAELPIDRTQQMPLFLPSRLRGDETPRQRLDVGPTPPSAMTQELVPIDPAATVELPQVPRSLTRRFQAVLPNATAQMLPVSPHETAKLDPVPSSQTMRFPTLPTSQRVPARSVPITAPPPSYSAEIPSPSDPDKGESTAEIARAALASAATMEMPMVPSDDRDAESVLSVSTRSLPKISLPPPSEDTLPPLPLLPPSDTLWGRLSYAVSGLRSLMRRRKQLRCLLRDLGERLSAYDRALVQLGELAYAENIELLRDPKNSDGAVSTELPASKDAALLAVQVVADRLWAKAQKEQRSLARKEAVLSSELRVLRHRRDELYQRLLLLAGDPHASEASGDERFSVGNELTGIESDRQKVAARLGEVRALWRLVRRKNHHLKSRRAELVYALSLEYAESVQKSPHLLVLGTLCASVRPLPAFGKDKRARFDSLYAVLDALRSGIAKVETRLALLDGDRRAADQKAWKSALLLLGGLALIGGGIVGGLLYYLLLP